MPFKLSLIFNFSTNPHDLANARVHTGGYTESFWGRGNFSDTELPFVRALANSRASLLPTTTTITGYRAQQYVVQGNRLIPGGTNSGAINFPGTVSGGTDVPQVALECRAAAVGAANTRKFVIHNLPDSQIGGGEFQPTPAFSGALTRYFNQIVAGFWAFPGRVLSNPSFRVNSIIAGVITLENPFGIAEGNFIRLLKCRDINGNPVVGSFRVTGVAGNAFTVAGMPPTTDVLNSGRARLDAVDVFLMTGLQQTRAVSRKVGLPTERYRGRRSKRR